MGKQPKISIFHGNDEETHEKFQAWRRANVDGFHMTEGAKGQFTIHYAQDKRDYVPDKREKNPAKRGCCHQGGSGNEYLEDSCTRQPGKSVQTVSKS